MSLGQLLDGQERSLSTGDGVVHPCRVWTSRQPRACVFYLHGIEGHSQWFANTAACLAGRGINVWAVDRRGAGSSSEPRGHIESCEVFLSDARELLKQVQEAEQLPLFLMANCWGAKIAAVIAQKSDPASRLLSGLVLSSPAVAVKVDVTFSQKLKIIWNHLTGNLAPIEIPLTPEHFTDNPFYLEFIRNDRLRLTHATGRFFVEGFILTLLSQKAARNIQMPVLVVQAGTDRIVSDGGLLRWFEELGSGDKKMQVFEGVHHSMDFDRDPSKYQEALCQFILDRCAGSAM